MNGTKWNNSFNQNAVLVEYPLYLSAPMLTIELIIAVIGVLGNILVCLAITKRANMKTSMNLYLRNLAITDLGVLLLIFPLSADLVRSKKGWPLGRFVCLYIYPSLDTFFAVSIWSITVIAIERYRNIISRKVFVKKAESFKRVMTKIVLIWLLSFALVAVPMYPIYIYVPTVHGDACFPQWPAFMNFVMFKAYSVYLALFWYVLPFGIITMTYWKISAQLRQSNTFHKTMHGEDTVKSKLFKEEEKRRLKQNKKAQRILTPLVVIFAVTMLPFNIFRSLSGFMPETLNPHNMGLYYFLFLDLCILGMVINSAVDPIVYYLCSKEFRAGIKALFFKGNFKECRYTTNHSNSPKATTRSLITADCGTMAVDSM